MFQIHSPQTACWISLVGPDTADFLQRVSTVNVRELAPGEGHPGCFLNPQGRLRASFRLWRSGEQEFGFEFDAGHQPEGRWKSELLKFIDEFTFAEKMKVTDPPQDLTCRWLLGAMPGKLGELGPWKTLALENGIRVCHHGSRDFARAWVSAWGNPERLSGWLDQLAKDSAPALSLDPRSELIGPELVERWRILAVSPRIDSELRFEETNPLEAGLAEAISSNKGCYPGQEVIEKIISLGSPPRRLVRLEGVGNPPEVGEAIVNFAAPPLEMGQVTSLTLEAGTFVALALVRKTHAKEGIQVQFKKTVGSQARITQVSPYA